MDFLPESVARAAREVARFAKVPVVSPAIIGLSCVATAIGKKAVIVEREGLEHHPALFQCLIAASGERKSPAFANMTNPLEDWADTKRKHYEEMHREAKANNDTLDAALAGLTVKAKKETANLEKIMQERINLETRKIPLPIFPSLFTTDTTEERLFQKMHDRDGAYAVMSGEGRQVFDAIMGKYSGEGRTGDAIYLAGISGDTVTRDRVGGDQGPEERVIRHPCLNVCIMVQPDKYLAVAGVKALRESGALARIWPVFLPSLVGSRMEEKDEADLKAQEMAPYHDMILSILDARPIVDLEGVTSCHKVLLSETAKEARREFHNAIEILMSQGQEYADVTDIASKAVTQTVKLALVLHIAHAPAVLQTQQSILSIEVWAKAQVLGTFHLLEVIRVQRIADEGQQLEHARRLLLWIQQEQKKEVTATFISQLGPRPRHKVDHVKQLLEILTDLGYLRPKERKGSRALIYIVNPLWLSSQNSHNSQG